MSRRSAALKKYPEVDAAVVNELFDKDPSRGAYGDWMVRRVKGGEHPEVVVSVVSMFHEHKTRLPKDQRDLYSYLDSSKVRASIEAIGEISQREQRRTRKGYSLIREYPLVSFYRVDSFVGMRTLGRGTKWCTTKKDTYKHNYADHLIVVAISRIREARDRWSKFALVSDHEIKKGSLQRFYSWKDLKAAHSSPSYSWKVWDAMDRTYRQGYHDCPLTELLDVAAGTRGATADVMHSAMGGTAYMDTMEELRHLLHQKSTSDNAIRLAQVAAEHGLFNPLSLMTHPKALKRATQSIWEATGEKYLRKTDHEGLTALASTHAINIPAILERYLNSCNCVSTHAYASPVLPPLLANKRLTVESRRRILAHLRENVLRLPEE